MTTRPSLLRRTLNRAVLTALPLLLAACGGGSNDTVPPPLSCSVADQKVWLASYMNDWYFWYRLSPTPSPALYPTLDGYFEALLYDGSDPAFPPDRFSYYESTESFNRFFGDGMTLGYGLFVAGIEVEGHPELPLRVRYIEPKSDAGAKSLLRGEEIVSVNGRPASELIAANDYAVLTPQAEGETLDLVVRGSGGDRSVTLTATVYELTPVSATAVVTTPLGRKMGYVLVKDMISQAGAPLDAAFAEFKRQGVTEVALDLRYNGGGLVSMGRTVASYVGGNRTAGQDYVRLLYNDKQSAYNETFPFTNPSAGLGLAKVYVLTGPRTCSASEQVINGLRPYVNVVAIGDTTCGKPVGFLPQENYCGTTFSVVNFESVNALNQGRYFDGLDATCAATDDLSLPLGSPDEGLLATARAHADTGSCPATARERPQTRRLPGSRTTEPGDRQGMVGR
jgi:hypothetical protein